MSRDDAFQNAMNFIATNLVDEIRSAVAEEVAASVNDTRLLNKIKRKVMDAIVDIEFNEDSSDNMITQKESVSSVTSSQQQMQTEYAKDIVREDDVIKASSSNENAQEDNENVGNKHASTETEESRRKKRKKRKRNDSQDSSDDRNSYFFCNQQ